MSPSPDFVRKAILASAQGWTPSPPYTWLIPTGCDDYRTFEAVLADVLYYKMTAENMLEELRQMKRGK